MKRKWISVLALCVLVGSAAAGGERPNVVVIMADDLGYGDLGYTGCKDIPTPNIDRLAASGVVFSEGYVTMPYCAPSRAGFITGRHPASFGFLMNPTPILAKDQGLPPGCDTFPKYLQEQGYVTGAVGKWHLGSTPDRHPNNMGFTEWYGFLGGAHAYFPLDDPLYKGLYQKPKPWDEWMVNQGMPILKNFEPVDYDQYLTTDFTEQGIRFIETYKNKPFFLFMSYTSPHSPWEAPAETIAKFPEASLDVPDEVTPRNRAIYAAMVYELDVGVGRLLESLEQNGLTEKTLVIFLSDNGGPPNHKNHSPACNRPFRGTKDQFYEGGVHVPFIASWPGTVPAGKTVDVPVWALDIGATAVALSGADMTKVDLHGKDLTPLLTGRSNAPLHDALCWKHGYRAEGAIRAGKYKLLTRQGKAVGLYDLSNDIAEANDLSAAFPEVTERLLKQWNDWNGETASPIWENVPREYWKEDRYQYSSDDYMKGTRHYKVGL